MRYAALSILLLLSGCSLYEIHLIPKMEPDSQEEIYYYAWRAKKQNDLYLQRRFQ